MTITMPGRFTLGAAVALLALTALFLAVVATSTGAVQGNEQQCEYDVILMEQVCTSPDGETTLSTTSTPTPEPTEEGPGRWMPVPDVLHDGSLRPTKVASVIPPIPPIKDFTYTISTATPKPRVKTLRQVRDVQVQDNQGAQGQGAQAQQTTPTSTALVKNTGQMPTWAMGAQRDRAQAFTTGSDMNGYKLTSVTIGFDTPGNIAHFTVAITEVTEGTNHDRPGTQVGTLKKPSSLSGGLNTFTAAGSGLDLDANTEYMVFVDFVNYHSNRLSGTTPNNEDAGAADGWSISNVHTYRDVNDMHWDTAGSDKGTGKIRIAINGYVDVLRLVSAEVTDTTLVLTFNKNLDTASRPAAGQFGIKFGGGSLQRATAISISGKQVTLTVPEVRAGQVVTVSYTKPTSRPLRNTEGQDADAFSDQPVTVSGEKVRNAQYVTYTNADGENEVVENRAASADLDTLLDYFRDSCISRRSLQTVHDYGWVGAYGRMQARNGWRWLERQNANGEVTHTSPMTIDECVSHSWFERRAFCENLDNGIVSLPEGAREGTCPTNRTW